MTYWTRLMIKVHDGDAKAAADAHTKRRSIEEAAESIPGFVHGETVLREVERCWGLTNASLRKKDSSPSPFGVHTSTSRKSKKAHSNQANWPTWSCSRMIP